MNPRELEALLRELMQGITTVIQSGEVLSDEFQGMLATTLSNLVETLDRSTQEDIETNPEGPIENAPSNDAQLLWHLSGQQPQAFISYLRTFPTPATRQLLENPEQLNATIVQLQRTMPEANLGIIHGIPQADLQSSNVWGARYDPKSGKMRVRFQGGSEYEYAGVPQAIFDAFIHGNANAKTSGQNRYGRWWKGKNPSLGAALNQYIKAGGFDYRKIR